MRGIQIDRHGGPEVLTIREVPEPVPEAGEVLIRSTASSLNPVDWKTRTWDIGPELPATLGWDLAGVVIAGGGTAFRPGDHVIAGRRGLHFRSHEDLPLRRFRGRA
ncbi:alcohol dehydrogenase catalytic domain-containing protein [Microtetraspora malaysiensis]|uniref:alcohol dehydrogenase catalytic domain-containing protein n=1 Tax=Microtetraspora malaysiensis TaxID=161358 RepID=UPI003D90E068